MTNKAIKFSSKIDPEVWERLKEYAEQNKQNISDVISTAVAEHLDNLQIRPVFRLAAQQVMQENNELLTRLAK